MVEAALSCCPSFFVVLRVNKNALRVFTDGGCPHPTWPVWDPNREIVHLLDFSIWTSAINLHDDTIIMTPNRHINDNATVSFRKGEYITARVLAMLN
jgi:hypothetical protein